MSILTREQILKSLTSHFELQTEMFGTVKVKIISVGAIQKIIKSMPDYKDRPGREVALACISIIAEREDETKVDGTQLTEPELTELADRYLESNPQITDSEGKPVVAVKRAEGESSIDYMGRVIAYEITSLNDSMAKVVDRSGIMKASKEINTLSSLLKDNTALASIKGIHTATDSLRFALKDVERFKALESPAMQIFKDLNKQQELLDSVFPKYVQDAQKMQGVIKDYPASHLHEEMITSSAAFRPQPVPKIDMEAFKMPPNPVHKTNEKLDDLNERMDAFTETLAGHLEASAVAVQEIASEIKAGSKGTSKQNWWAIGIAAISLIVAVASFFKDSFKSHPSDTKQPAAATTSTATSPAPVRPPAPAKPSIPETQTSNSK